MNDTQSPSGAQPTPAFKFAELVALVAAVMALNALAIDMMLPALGQIQNDLGARDDNDRQLIVIVYLLGNGFAQLFFGPIVDRFGRKRVILLALCGYILGSFLSTIASTFTMLLAARAFQGIATAATRVAAIALVRDMSSGRRMSQVMSLAITIFMAAPILAPGFGQVILSVGGPWRAIFAALLVYGIVLLVWIWIRLPETFTADKIVPLNPKRILQGYATFLTNRMSIGYTLASSFCFGAMFAYISASEQIYLEFFGIGEAFAFAFAATAAAFGLATLVNARFVERWGMRRLSHIAIIVFILVNLFHVAVVAAGGENLVTFMLFVGAGFFCIGLIGPNATAIAMEPMAHIAGAASGANGFAGTTMAGFLGWAIAARYNDTTMPIVFGFLVMSLAAFVLILWAERGALFQPQHELPADQ